MSQAHLYRVLYKFDAQNDIELSCQVGDILISDAKPHENWLMVAKYFDMNGQKGFVPVTFIEKMTSQQEAKFLANNERKDATVSNNSQDKKQENGTNAPRDATGSNNSSNTAQKNSKLEQRREKKARAKEQSGRNDNHTQNTQSTSRNNAPQNQNKISNQRASGRSDLPASRNKSSTINNEENNRDGERNRLSLLSNGPSNDANEDIFPRTDSDSKIDNSDIDTRNSYFSKRFTNEPPSQLGDELLANRRSTLPKNFSVDISRPPTTSSIQQIFEMHANERHNLFDEYNEELHKTTDLIHLSQKETHDLLQRIRQLENQINIEQNNLKSHH